MNEPRIVQAQRIIAAPAAEIFELLATPSEHSRFDGSGSVKNSIQGPERLHLGAKFSMSMKMGLPYRITSEVVEFDEGKRIAWRHMGHHIWRYELEPVEQGTSVVESFDWRPARAPRLYELIGYPEKNRRAMEATLERLASLLEATT